VRARGTAQCRHDLAENKLISDSPPHDGEHFATRPAGVRRDGEIDVELVDGD
jgi:hypothetical protein